MEKQEIFELIKKYNAGTASSIEMELIETWYLQYEDDATDLSDEEREYALDQIWNKLPVNNRKTRKLGLWYRVAAAAAIFIAITAGIYYTTQTPFDQQAQAIHEIALTTKPGSHQAVLILSGGKQIVLNASGNGQLTTQANNTIIKTAEGKVIYQANGNQGNNQQLIYNTLITPLGGTYDLTLSDGSRVTLDAGSSIRYPVNFPGKERRVDITGQAYFEIAHNKLKPFRVTSGGQTVEVLGTHFNVNAYTEENVIRTTLLEGSVRIAKGGHVAVLRPGQQSTVNQKSDVIAVNNTDIEIVTAWKDGIFRFKRADLKAVMLQFSRWYNIKVVYEGEAPRAAITGKVLRTENATQVLEILNKLGIKFRAENKKIIIENN